MFHSISSPTRKDIELKIHEGESCFDSNGWNLLELNKIIGLETLGRTENEAEWFEIRFEIDSKNTSKTRIR